MTTGEVTFAETAAAPAAESVGLSHLSLELGHLYMEDFALGEGHLTDYFGRVVPWVAAARMMSAERRGNNAPRVSTCFLIDDYFSQLGEPREIIEMVMRAADKHELTIDYIARESGCATADGIDLAGLVRDQLVSEPPPNTNGSRPPTAETGWLCNGKRSPNVDAALAMTSTRWGPPAQNAVNRHSIFLDVELWNDKQWSCAFLAAVWQLLRLGLIRHDGAQVARSVPFTGSFPAAWPELPAVLKMNDKAAPFSAYRTFSILGSRFVETEHATRVILSQVPIADKVRRQVEERSHAEKMDLPKDILDRIEYCFLSD